MDLKETYSISNLSYFVNLAVRRLQSFYCTGSIQIIILLNIMVHIKINTGTLRGAPGLKAQSLEPHVTKVFNV
jgi:hypothetical protein